MTALGRTYTSAMTRGVVGKCANASRNLNFQRCLPKFNQLFSGIAGARIGHQEICFKTRCTS